MNRIQQIFRDHRDAFLAQATLTPEQRKAFEAICECRSGARGHHLYACAHCGHHHLANSSCGNRHCPVCQHEKNVRWVQRQQQRRLPCTYFMATFTLPEGMRAVARAHPNEVYAALLDGAAEALRTLEADPRFVGCPVAGFFGVLHTWGRQLQYHPHAHFIVPGGGLTNDRSRWVPASGHFLVHVRALSRMFRGKFKARMHAARLLQTIPKEVWSQEWVVHCEAVGNGEHALQYLGAYVFRVAISDARIVDYTPASDGRAATVTFKYQKVGSSKWRTLTLDIFEFLRRFLAHVLPTGFVKVRHYGFLSPNFAVPIQRIRELICLLYETLRESVATKPQPRGSQPLRCRHCKALLRWVRFIPALGTPSSA